MLFAVSVEQNFQQTSLRTLTQIYVLQMNEKAMH